MITSGLHKIEYLSSEEAQITACITDFQQAVKSFNIDLEVISFRLNKVEKDISRIDVEIQWLALEKASRQAEISEDKKKLTTCEEKAKHFEG